MENADHVIDSLKALNYPSHCLRRKTLARALNGGAFCSEFRELCAWIALELADYGKSFPNVTQDLNDGFEFSAELIKMLHALNCCFEILLTGEFSERFVKKSTNLLVIGFLLNELIACKMQEYKQLQKTTIIVSKIESPTARSLMQLSIDVHAGRPPKTITPQEFFDKIKKKLMLAMPEENRCIIGHAMLQKQPNTYDWGKLKAIEEAILTEYDVGRQNMLSRMQQVIETVQGMQCYQKRDQIFEDLMHSQLKNLEPYFYGGNSINLVGLLSTRTDYVTPKTSHTSIATQLLDDEIQGPNLDSATEEQLEQHKPAKVLSKKSIKQNRKLYYSRLAEAKTNPLVAQTETTTSRQTALNKRNITPRQQSSAITKEFALDTLKRPNSKSDKRSTTTEKLNIRAHSNNEIKDSKATVGCKKVSTSKNIKLKPQEIVKHSAMEFARAYKIPAQCLPKTRKPMAVPKVGFGRSIPLIEQSSMAQNSPKRQPRNYLKSALRAKFVNATTLALKSSNCAIDCSKQITAKRSHTTIDNNVNKKLEEAITEAVKLTHTENRAKVEPQQNVNNTTTTGTGKNYYKLFTDLVEKRRLVGGETGQLVDSKAGTLASQSVVDVSAAFVNVDQRNHGINLLGLAKTSTKEFNSKIANPCDDKFKIPKWVLHCRKKNLAPAVNTPEQFENANVTCRFKQPNANTMNALTSDTFTKNKSTEMTKPIKEKTETKVTNNALSVVTSGNDAKSKNIAAAIAKQKVPSKLQVGTDTKAKVPKRPPRKRADLPSLFCKSGRITEAKEPTELKPIKTQNRNNIKHIASGKTIATSTATLHRDSTAPNCLKNYAAVLTKRVSATQQIRVTTEQLESNETTTVIEKTEQIIIKKTSKHKLKTVQAPVQRQLSLKPLLRSTKISQALNKLRKRKMDKRTRNHNDEEPTSSKLVKKKYWHKLTTLILRKHNSAAAQATSLKKSVLSICESF